MRVPIDRMMLGEARSMAHQLTAEVTRLTRERNEARGAWNRASDDRDAAESEVTRLTEALAAAEQHAGEWQDKAGEYLSQAEVAEARVRELEANQRDANTYLADLESRLTDAEGKNESLGSENDDVADAMQSHAARADAAESECAALRARLVAANALLADAIPANVCKAPWLLRRDEHFAACGFNPVNTAHLAVAAQEKKP